MKKLLLLFLFTFFSFNAAFAQDDEINEDTNTEDVSTDEEEYEEEDPDAFFIDHKITLGEKMIMVSKKYMVDPKDIYKYNDWAVNGLQPGLVLKIPLHKSHKKDLDAFKAKLEKEKGGPIQVATPRRKKIRDIKPEDY